MKLSNRQRRVLERLYPYPAFLYEEVVEAFFAWSDKGESFWKLSQSLPPGGAWQLKNLADAHKFSWHSNWFEAQLREDFQKGLSTLGDWDFGATPYDDYCRQQALRVYAEAFGQTTFWRRVKAWWEQGWKAGRPVGYGFFSLAPAVWSPW